MSIFTRIFDVFSRRSGSLASSGCDVPTATRNRVVLWCNEAFSNSRTQDSSGDYSSEFWHQVHRLLRYRHGRFQLYGGARPPASPVEDSVAFLTTCRGEEFLDFLEYIFHVDCLFHVALPENQLVDELNDLLRQDDLPYHVTNMAKETVEETINGRKAKVVKTVAYPRVIMRENDVLHSETIVPALTLLQRPAFKTANVEYLEALEDYRKGDFGDSLAKCGSCFESVLKILCDRKGWPYRQTDTASSLVRTVLDNTSLDNYFEPVLMIVATLRNRLSKSHGAGPSMRKVPRHLARYALHASAAAILLLLEESGEQ